MADANRIGQARIRPAGDWVQTTLVESVVGVQYHRSEVDAFVKAVEVAERKGLGYGVALKPQPDNEHDKTAIAVLGLAAVKGIFGRKTKRWHIGFIGRELAAELNDDLLSNGVPIAAELYEIYLGHDEFVDIKIIVLAPPGYGHSKRTGA